MLSIRSGDGWVEFSVRVTPRSHRDRVVGLIESDLRVAVRAAPKEGGANQALIATLAKALKVPKSSIAIVSGETSRSKRVRVSGLDQGRVIQRLGLG